MLSNQHFVSVNNWELSKWVSSNVIFIFLQSMQIDVDSYFMASCSVAEKIHINTSQLVYVRIPSQIKLL